MPASQTTRKQHSPAGHPPAMFVESPRRGPYRTWYGKLATCPVHYWSGPNVSVVDDGSATCWETGHALDAGDVLRAAR